MKLQRPSTTAEYASMVRALAHMTAKSNDIVADELAHHFVGFRVYPAYLANRMLLFLLGERAWQIGRMELGLLFALCRHRYFNDFMAQKSREGFEQLVVLGAGYATCPMRDETFKTYKNIFELDHPATQNRKIKIIRRRGLNIPTNLHFVPCNLEVSSPLNCLFAAGLDPSLKTIVVAEGLISYLRLKQLDGVLKEIRRLGTSVCFAADYRYESIEQQDAGASIHRWRRQFSRLGEKYRTLFNPDQAEELLEKCGFEVELNENLREIAGRYAESLFNESEAMSISGLIVGNYSVSK